MKRKHLWRASGDKRCQGKERGALWETRRDGRPLTGHSAVLQGTQWRENNELDLTRGCPGQFEGHMRQSCCAGRTPVVSPDF